MLLVTGFSMLHESGTGVSDRFEFVFELDYSYEFSFCCEYLSTS